MTACVLPAIPDRAMLRVSRALMAVAPVGMRFTQSPGEAEFVILHVNGRRDGFMRQAYRALQRGQRYAVIQYALRSTLSPHVADWATLWRYAAAVWSYYDLAALAAEDGVDVNSVRLYHAPLGVSEEFQDAGINRSITVLTTGTSWLTEGVREATLAARAAGGTGLHLGPSVGRGTRSVSQLTDKQLALVYSSVRWVCGLRRVEGFELPAAEGLACGARPVLYDRPHYRQWYGDLADYVPERPRPEVLESVTRLFRSPWRRVTPAERGEARRRFDWTRLAADFWERALA